MDVRCERCRVQYVIDDARIPEAGVKVSCTQCGHGFLLKKKTLAVAVPLRTGDGDVPLPITDLATESGSRASPAEDRTEWRLRRAGGAIFPFRELSTLQRWIVERKASREDEVAGAGGEPWRRLGEIPELASFFAVVDRATRKGEPRQEPQIQETPPTAALEDPAWARGPARPARRITRSVSLPARPRRRLLWTALLVVALLAVAAGTVYLRRRAEAEIASRSAEPPLAQVAQRPVPPPPVAEPRPDPEPRREPEPEPVAAPVPPPAASPAEPDHAAAPTGPVEGHAAAPAAPPGAEVLSGSMSVVAAAPADPARSAARNDPGAPLRSLLARAREQRDRGRCEAALDLYGQALAIDGRNATALAGRGACYLDLSRYVQAEASFGEALESDPRNAEALFGLAETCRYLGRTSEAVARYEQFLEVRPNGDEAAAARRLISQLKE